MINSISITELKQNTAGVLGELKSTKKPVIVYQRSKPAAVIVDPEYFEKMESLLEDMDDLREIQKRSSEPRVALDEVENKLGL